MGSGGSASPEVAACGWTRWAAPLVLAALVLLGACAAPPQPAAPPPAPPPPASPRTLVVLMPNADGTVGAIEVQGPGGTQRLSQPQQATFADGRDAPFAVTTAQLDERFTAARAAMPAAPQTFVLYFLTGTATLTPQSRDLLPDILAAAAARPALELSVVGHTDTVGRPEINFALGLQRATLIADLIRNRGIPTAAVVVESHGESNLLVKTPDETAEPANRRVEVTLR
jgi:peptidoglycan-associated lipoprotein